jgi:hypothetical protein
MRTARSDAFSHSASESLVLVLSSSTTRGNRRPPGLETTTRMIRCSPHGSLWGGESSPAFQGGRFMPAYVSYVFVTIYRYRSCERVGLSGLCRASIYVEFCDDLIAIARALQFNSRSPANQRGYIYPTTAPHETGRATTQSKSVWHKDMHSASGAIQSPHIACSSRKPYLKIIANTRKHPHQSRRPNNNLPARVQSNTTPSPRQNQDKTFRRPVPLQATHLTYISSRQESTI